MQKQLKKKENVYIWEAKNLINYHLLKKSIEYNWSAAYRQRSQFGINVQKTIISLKTVEEFQERLENDHDMMYDIEKYRNLLKLSSFPGKVYWLAERTFWNSHFEKAKNVFNFFLLPENKDGFVRGASHFFLGRTLASVFDNDIPINFISSNQEALIHFIKVPTFPTCLTYITYSYIAAAQSAALLNDYRSALALIFVEVPSIDHDTFAGLRHSLAADYCINLKDYTNCIKHIQTAISFDQRFASRANDILKILPNDFRNESLWNYCATNKLSIIDKHNAVVAALTNENAVVEFNDLYDALTIKWPEIDQLPEGIMTNRVLNNCFFKTSVENDYKKYKVNK